MDTKGERREKKRNSLKKKSSDNRKSISLIIDLIKKRSKANKKKIKNECKVWSGIRELNSSLDLGKVA